MPLPAVVSPPPTFTCFNYIIEGDVVIAQVKVEHADASDLQTYTMISNQLRSLRKYFKQPAMIIDFSRIERFTTDAFSHFDCMWRKMHEGGRKLVLCGLNEELSAKLELAYGRVTTSPTIATARLDIVA